MVLRLRDEVSCSETESGAVLLDERTGEYFQLNPTSAQAVLLLLAGCWSVDTAAALAEEFDVEPAQAQRDVDSLLDQLRVSKLITGLS